jgi:hypothetical protein
MPKKLPTPAEMKAAVEAFKSKFTPGFYHGSPNPNIKAFDPMKSTVRDTDFVTPGVTFVTKSPNFADSFTNGKGPYISLKTGDAVPAQSYTKGATMYPVSVDLSNHFDPTTPAGFDVVRDYVAKKYADDPKMAEKFKSRILDPHSNWTTMESPSFLQHLRDTGHTSFAVNEGGYPNVGVLDPSKIRGKFAEYNPAEAANPDFMKAAGGSIQNFQSGGVSLAKKALEFAKKLPFVHYSTAPNISRLEPQMYGTGIKGAEAARLKDAPDIKPRSYFYVDKGADTMRPEQGLGPHKYAGVAEDIYPLHEDPAGFGSIAKQKAIDPYMMQFGREVVDPAAHLNELERLIKGAGYKGYANDDVGLLFHPTEVKKVTD